MFWAACFSSSAASRSVSTAFPASWAGRSNGVMVALVQTPWRSGWPSAVRGGFQGLGFELCADAIEIEMAKTATVRQSTLKPPERYGVRDAVYAAIDTISSTVSFATASFISCVQGPLRLPV